MTEVIPGELVVFANGKQLLLFLVSLWYLPMANSYSGIFNKTDLPMANRNEFLPNTLIP
jgi:hypothetical protein